jgi:predicted RNase H-like HicB family nuclease
VHLSIELDREDDGRWIAEALELPGVMTYGQTREEAIGNTERLAIEAVAGRINREELPPSALNVSFQVLSKRLAGFPIVRGRRPATIPDRRAVGRIPGGQHPILPDSAHTRWSRQYIDRPRTGKGRQTPVRQALPLGRV